MADSQISKQFSGSYCLTEEVFFVSVKRGVVTHFLPSYKQLY